MKNKRFKASILFMILVLLAGGYFFFANGGLMLVGFAFWRAKMWQGKRYMQSLDHEEKVEWIKDAEALLKIDSLKSKCIGAIDGNDSRFSSKYKRLGIIMVDVCDDHVNYMWMGGMDHTGLYIHKDKNGSMKITAGFNDYEKQEIYPEVKGIQSDLRRR